MKVSIRVLLWILPILALSSFLSAPAWADDGLDTKTRKVVRLCEETFTRIALRTFGQFERAGTKPVVSKLEALNYFQSPAALARPDAKPAPFLTAAQVIPMLEELFPPPTKDGVPKVTSHRRIYIALAARIYADKLNAMAQGADGKLNAQGHGEAARALLQESIEKAFDDVSTFVAANDDVRIRPAAARDLVAPLLELGLPLATIHSALEAARSPAPNGELAKLLSQATAIQSVHPSVPISKKDDFGRLKGKLTSEFTGIDKKLTEEFLHFIVDDAKNSGSAKTWEQYAQEFSARRIEQFVGDHFDKVDQRRIAAAQKLATREKNAAIGTALEKNLREGLLDPLLGDGRKPSPTQLADATNFLATPELWTAMKEQPWLVEAGPSALKTGHASLRGFMRDVSHDDVVEALRLFSKATRKVPGVIDWVTEERDGMDPSVSLTAKLSTGKSVFVVMSYQDWRNKPIWRLTTVYQPYAAGGDSAEDAVVITKRMGELVGPRVRGLASTDGSPTLVTSAAHSDLAGLKLSAAEATATIAAGNAVRVDNDKDLYRYFENGTTTYCFYDASKNFYVMASLEQQRGQPDRVRIERILSGPKK